MPWKGCAIKLFDFNGQRWTRREVLIWMAAMIVAVILGVLSVTNVLGSWVLLVAPILTFGVVLMRYRANVRVPRRPEHGIDRSES